MIEEPKRLRIARHRPRPDPAHVAALAAHPTGFVLDAMYGAGAMDARIKPLPGLPGRLCGPVLTVGNRPGDILASLAALEVIEAGQVLVAAFDGHAGCAAGGDRLVGMLRNAGGAGFVTDGPMRDLAGLADVGLPVFCAGLTPGSPVVAGPGTVGLPVVLGGVAVETGDVVVADADGVVVVPGRMVPAVAAAVDRVARAEAALDAEVAAGRASVDAIRAMLEGDDVEWVESDPAAP